MMDSFYNVSKTVILNLNDRKKKKKSFLQSDLNHIVTLISTILKCIQSYNIHSKRSILQLNN